MAKAPFGTAFYIDKSKIEIDNSFDFLTEVIKNQLGLTGYKIEARLHKLVLYMKKEEVLIGIKIQKNQKKQLVV